MKDQKENKIGIVGLTGQTVFFRTQHLPRPGETVACEEMFFEAGGKGHNQAAACAKLGAKAVFVGAVGRDENARICEAALRQDGVQPCLIEKDAPTAFAAVSTDADGENCVQVCAGAASQLTAKDILHGGARSVLQDCEVLLIQNEIPAECIEAVLQLAEETGARVVFNPAPAGGIPREIYAGCWVVTPNEEEAKCIAGFAPGQAVSDEALCAALCKAGVRRAVVTLGGSGVLLADENGCCRLPACRAGRVVDTTGAGDTFNGALCAALVQGCDLRQAAQFAVTAAGISVTRPGAASSVPTLDEVRRQLKNRE